MLKQVMQHSTVGAKHALDCRYTGPYEIIAVDNSSVTLDSPSAKFASPVKCHIDQLKPFMLPDSPSTSPAWDHGLRHQINVPLSPVSSRMRKRTHSHEKSDKKCEPPHKVTTRSVTAEQLQNVPLSTDKEATHSDNKNNNNQASETSSAGSESKMPANRATSPSGRRLVLSTAQGKGE